MKASRAFQISLAFVLVLSVVIEARTTRHRPHSRKQQEEESPAVSQVQQDEPKPVEVEPSQSEEVSNKATVEKSRPVRQRKAPIICNANTAASNVGAVDKKETPAKSIEVIEPKSAESMEVPSSEESEEKKIVEAPKSKPVKKPTGKVVAASSEESDEDDESNDDEESDNLSAAAKSLEEPEAPKALTSIEIPKQESAPAVESEEGPKPKARRAKHHRSDVRKIERPHRRRVVFHSDEE